MPASIDHPSPYVVVDGMFITNLERVTIRFVAVPSTNKLGKSYIPKLIVDHAEPYIFQDGKRVTKRWEVGLFWEEPEHSEEANANTA